MSGSYVWIILSFALVAPLVASQDVTWYEYYTAGGRQSGLVPANADAFTLNGKPFRVVSGSIHYFRVHPAYWRDRLKKLRAIGANTVETYMPWNLHEPRQGEYDFGEGNNDMSAFLNVTAFVEIAREEDLFVILRPGPYICAEWEFGGMPSWLLRDPNMQVRSNYPGYLTAAEGYLEQVFQRVGGQQFTLGDGPVIAFQVENEYGAFGSDTTYLIRLRDKMVQSGAVEMFFTSDNGNFENGRIPGTLTTANFNFNWNSSMDQLRALQPDMPIMVAEYWTGWFDHWGDTGHDTGFSVADFTRALEDVYRRNGSSNFYMFHGGSTFGFMNGANVDTRNPFYAPDVSSYDYGAPLTEAGDYTPKYYAAQELIAKYRWIPNIALPVQPPQTVKRAYPTIQAVQHLTLENLLSQVPTNLVVQSNNLLAMEDLPINNNNGQSYGYIHYKKVAQLTNGRHEVKITGRPRDLAIFAVDGIGFTYGWDGFDKLGSFGYYGANDAKLNFTVNGDGDHTIGFTVENMGRNNYGKQRDFINQKRGLTEGPVQIDGVDVADWTIYPLEFTSAWVNSLTNWNNTPSPGSAFFNPPTLTRSILTLTAEPVDTFIVTSKTSSFGPGNRGVVFVNGFNIGRFSTVGPTKTMFVPAPLLKRGDNRIEVFALFWPVTSIAFTDQPVLG